METLKMGMTGDAVKALQTLINTATGAGLKPDGVFGKVTLNAVVLFQSKHKLTMTGAVDDATYAALEAAASEAKAPIKEAAAPTPAPAPAPQKQTAEVISVALLKQLFPAVGIEAHAQAINAALARFEINTPKRLACFLANVIVESRGLTVLTENLNYSAAGLATTWPTLYAHNGAPNAMANSLARRADKIANYTYANKNGNGSVDSGDGWKYRGRGPIMVTFRNNYRAYGKVLGIDLVNNPDLVATVDIGFLVACCHWHENNINRYADVLDFDGVCDVINGGRKTSKYGDAIGFVDRNAAFQKIRKYFSI